MKAKITEIFTSIQGEGAHSGTPMLFIRYSGCNRNCSFCDTKYHKSGVELDIQSIVAKIRNAKPRFVVHTGGEPTLQMEAIREIIERTPNNSHHLETNAEKMIKDKDLDLFDYIAFSPKNLRAAKRAAKMSVQHMMCDIKVVTDGEGMNKSFIDYATMLMPLTTKDRELNQRIRQRVWNNCICYNKNYCDRIHVSVWDQKRGV